MYSVLGMTDVLRNIIKTTPVIDGHSVTYGERGVQFDA